ncbi:UTP--glucose-1-phosphate uridylyltransferase GalU [Mycoplasmatota bacterium]|nr:UTP--glucose-1-phosphate uridylyltransferase GalU [Mycoplasmatota bacterium]
MIKKAVIPAAGYGTRFLPVTKALPKEMLPIIDRPTLEYIVNEAIDSGITDILLVVSGNKNSIVDYFDRNLELEYKLLERKKDYEYGLVTNIAVGANLYFIRQKEQLGLGHAVLQGETFVGQDDFAVLLGDDVYVNDDYPATKQMIDAYDKVKSSILGTIEVSLEDTKKYGICDPIKQSSDQLKVLKSVVEKPEPKNAPSRSAIGGRYILTSTIFKYLRSQSKGKGNEIQLTDAILRLMNEEKVYSFDVDARRYDVGKKIDYIEAIIDFGLKRDDLKDDIQALINKKSK